METKAYNKQNAELKAILTEDFKKEQTLEDIEFNREFLGKALTELRLKFFSLGGSLKKKKTDMFMFASFMMLADTYSIEVPSDYFVDFFKYLDGAISKDEMIDAFKNEAHLKEFL